MPTNRNYKLKQRRASLALLPHVRMILSEGIDFFGELDMTPVQKNRWGEVQRHLWVFIPGYFPPCEFDPPSWLPDARLPFLKEQWRLHKAEVMAYHIDKWRDGSRPWAFWMWDAPEPYPVFRPASGSGADHFAARKRQETKQYKFCSVTI